MLLLFIPSLPSKTARKKGGQDGATGHAAEEL